MPRLTPIPWQRFEKFLLSVGCTFERQEGDHRIYGRANLTRPLVVPTYPELPLFIIKNNLRVLGIDTKEYLKALERI